LKFFRPEACDTFEDIESYRVVFDAYRRHVDGLRESLPPHVLELTQPSGMEDGLVVRVDHDRQQRVLRLVLRCGDLQMGYYNLEVTYIDAEILPEHDIVLATIARSTKTQRHHECDLAYHEVDAAQGGRIEHRLIFYASPPRHQPAGAWLWFTVNCQELQWRRVPKRSRRLPSIDNRYPGGPAAYEHGLERNATDKNVEPPEPDSAGAGDSI
jgi:hypothetical protein